VLVVQAGPSPQMESQGQTLFLAALQQLVVGLVVQVTVQLVLVVLAAALEVVLVALKLVALELQVKDLLVEMLEQPMILLEEVGALVLPVIILVPLLAEAAVQAFALLSQDNECFMRVAAEVAVKAE
jgi:hypothetical protein